MVIAGSFPGLVVATCAWITWIVCTLVMVITVNVQPNAFSIVTVVMQRAYGVIITRSRFRRIKAAPLLIAFIYRTHIMVIAVHFGPVGTIAIHTFLTRGTGIAVVTGPEMRRVYAGPVDTFVISARIIIFTIHRLTCAYTCLAMVTRGAWIVIIA